MRKSGLDWRGYVFATLMVGAATAVFIQGRDYFAKGQWALLYLLLVVFVASRSGVRPAIAAAVAAFLSWNFFLLPPYHTFRIHDPKDWLSLLAFLVVGIIMGLQTGRLREREALARAREHETALLNAFSGHLVSDLSVGEMADALTSDLSGIVHAGSPALFIPGPAGTLTRAGGQTDAASDSEPVRRLVEWSFANSAPFGLPQCQASRPTRSESRRVPVPPPEAADPSVRGSMAVPLLTATRGVGVLYIGGKQDRQPWTGSEARLLMAVANQAAAFLERKQLQLIAVQADALREADRMKSTFVSSVSHELKTPLASATATLTSLLEGDLAWDESTVRDEMAAVLADLDRLNDSISSLVDLARLESSVWNPNREWYELGEILGTVVSRLPAKQRAGIEFDLPDGLPPVRVDYAQWVRVFGNLIENALAYGSPDGRVYVGAAVGGGSLRTWVEDKGPGVPPEEQSCIFAKFYRGTTSGRVSSGTGLGLAIAKEIVRSHGGTIWVEDVRPHGARFVISLPSDGEGTEG